MDCRLNRYHDGTRWTFWTAEQPAQPVQVEAAAEPQRPGQVSRPSGLRQDIYAAKEAVTGGLVFSDKEVGLLEAYLRPKEEVRALCGAHAMGSGVLAVTNHRLLFLFVGILRSNFLEVDWNDAKAIYFDKASKELSVFKVKPTKRAKPAFVVTVFDESDAIRLTNAARKSSAAPRLDIV